MLDPVVVERKASGVVHVGLLYTPEDAPGDDVETMLVLSAERAGTVAEDLTTLRKPPPAVRFDA